MKKIALVLSVVAVLLFAVTAQAQFDGFLKVAYPVSSDIEDDNNHSLNLEVNPTFYIDGEAGYTFDALGGIRPYVGFNAVEDLYDSYTIGTEVFVIKHVGVFFEHERVDNKISHDTGLSLAGVVFRY